ncbi:probable receptor-like protein kinase At4g10390 isoform X2 [Henckelia pumila]|uniref:probable receptor-like protein kinase At4g10390 isoform X2 n=1 Tax=Henckelia pumila TaxID=405737 RepID=UPI003C6DD144
MSTMEKKSKKTVGSSSEAFKTQQRKDDSTRVFTYAQLSEMTNQFDNLVGEGQYAKVYKGRLNNKDIAVKIYLKQKKMYWEALMAFDHPNIVTLLGTNDNNDDERLCLVLNYLPKNLEVVLEEGNLGWPQVHKILSQLAAAIGKISGKIFVVGDIKPKNVLLDEEYNVCLCDFGSAKIGGKDLPTVNTRQKKYYLMEREHQLPMSTVSV